MSMRMHNGDQRSSVSGSCTTRSAHAASLDDDVVRSSETELVVRVLSCYHRTSRMRRCRLPCRATGRTRTRLGLLLTFGCIVYYTSKAYRYRFAITRGGPAGFDRRRRAYVPACSVDPSRISHLRICNLRWHRRGATRPLTSHMWRRRPVGLCRIVHPARLSCIWIDFVLL